MPPVLYPDQPGGRTAEPVFCDARAHRVPLDRQDRRPVWPSRMFTIKLELEVYRRDHPGEAVLDASQGDGGMSLGGIPREELAEALARYLPARRTTAYGDPTGRADVRAAIAAAHRLEGRVPGKPADHVVAGDGGRDMLQKWYQFVVADTGLSGGSLLVGAAPWGSYTQGPYLSGLNILRAPGDADDGFRLRPEAVDAALERAAAEGWPVAGMVVTSPDNPTGAWTPPEAVARLVEHAVARGVPHVLVDLVYQAVTDATAAGAAPDAVPRVLDALSPEARDRVVFLDGLTKSAGASNVRHAHLVCPNPATVRRLKGIATHTVLPNALGEAAALAVYGAPEPARHPWVRRVVEPTAASRRLLRERLRAWGFRFIADQGYYAFINAWPWIGRRFPADRPLLDPDTGERVERVRDAADLKSWLTTRCGLAVIHGNVFHQPDFIRFSYANAPEVTRAALDRLHESLAALEDDR